MYPLNKNKNITSKAKQQSFIDKCYKDKDNQVALVAAPNLPIIAWFVFTLLSKIIKTGTLHDLLAIVAFGAIFTWAWLEIIAGVNYFRRALGVVILGLSIYNQLN